MEKLRIYTHIIIHKKKRERLTDGQSDYKVFPNLYHQIQNQYFLKVLCLYFYNSYPWTYKLLFLVQTISFTYKIMKAFSFTILKNVLNRNKKVWTSLEKFSSLTAITLKLICSEALFHDEYLSYSHKDAKHSLPRSNWYRIKSLPSAKLNFEVLTGHLIISLYKLL